MRVSVPSSYLSANHARLQRSSDGWVIEDLGSRNGVLVNGRQVSRTTLRPGDIVAVGRVYFILSEHRVPESWDSDPWATDLDLEHIDGADAGLLTLLPTLGLRLTRLRTEARSNSVITIVGETGTGKELLARAIHRLSRRRGPYLAMNCGAIPRDLIQSELFGHVKGAFTGAPGAPGYIRDAHRGTLLLDEIVAAPPEVQIALLRVLQERTVTPVGATRAQPVDVRFLAASQRLLSEAVVKQAFRPDLQARLESFVFELPPLGRRLEDAGLLLAHVLDSIGVTERDEPRLAPEAALHILQHEWPLNIREFVAAITRAWRGARGGIIDDAELPARTSAAPDNDPATLKDQLIANLRLAGGNVAEVARRMGKARPLVHRWLTKFDVDPDSFRR
jgi:DNA-binding NtrC family response regulator